MLAVRPSLVVFDLDGTLIDSSLDLCLSVNAALRHVGSPELSGEVISGYIGDGAATLVRRALGYAERSLSATEHQRFERAYLYFLLYYREHKLDNTRLYDGVLSSLRTIREASPDVLMAVLTNKPVRPSREICEGLGLSGYFFANYGGDSFATKKPDPEGLFRVVAEAQNLRGRQSAAQGEVVMVGDSGVDVLTAKRAGVRSLGCAYGLSPSSLRLAEPDQLCESATEWPRILGFQP